MKKKPTEKKGKAKKPTTALTATEEDRVCLERYPDLLPIADEIRKLHVKFIDRQRTNLIEAMKIGDLLIQAKKKIKYGDWIPWLEVGVGPGVGSRQSQTYMKAARNRDIIEKYLLDPRNESDSFPTLGEAIRLADARDREIKKIRSDHTYSKMLSDIRLASISKTEKEHHEDAHEETEQEFEEELERTTVELERLRDVWRSVRHSTIRHFIETLISESLWPFERTPAPPSGPNVLDDEEHYREVKALKRKGKKRLKKKGSDKGEAKKKH